MTTGEDVIGNPDGGTTLTLYIAGESTKSRRAVENLERFCSEHVSGPCEMKIVDITAAPALAREANIFVVPTLVRTHPQPPRRIIGDLSNFDEVREGLDLA